MGLRDRVGTPWDASPRGLWLGRRNTALPGGSALFHYLAGLTFGGAEEDRTPDLLNAIQALSQLSYSPIVIL